MFSQNLQILMIFLASTAFGYGKHFSTGENVNCMALLEAQPQLNEFRQCVPQVISEVEVPAQDKNYGANIIKRTVHGTDCLQDTMFINFNKLVTYPLDAVDETLVPLLDVSFSGVSVLTYISNYAPSEIRHGERYYIEYFPDSVSAQDDQKYLELVARNIIGEKKIRIQYVAAEKRFTVLINQSYGAASALADFSKGVENPRARVEIPLDQVIHFPDHRMYTLNVSCSPDTTNSK